MLRSSHGKGPGRPEDRPAKPAKPAKPARALPPMPAKKEEAGEAKAGEAKAGEAKVKKARLPRTSDLPNVSEASDEARELAVVIAVSALEKKATGLEVIDVAGKVDYADFLVLMSGRSDRHVAALAAGIEEALRKRNKRALAVEGLPHANWVLMDFGDVVVHVFQDDARATYDIDGLWMDARRVPVPIDAPPAETAPQS